MATLADTAYYARNIFLYGAIILVVLIIGRVILTGAYNYYQVLNPPAPPPPDIAFGIIPPIAFPNSSAKPSGYRLETPDGSIPYIADRAKVFVMPERRSRFLALDQAIEDAKKMNFTADPIQRSPVLYRFVRTEPLPATLDFYIYEGRFNISVDWTKDPSFLTTRGLGSEAQAQTEVFSFLRRSNFSPEDLTKGETKISYLKASGGAYSTTISLSEADFIQVDIFRAQIDGKFAVNTPDPNQGIVRAIVSGGSGLSRIVKLEYNYAAVDYLSAGIYPIKDANQAWAELQAGYGYIARMNSGVEVVTVRRIELGYFDSYQPQLFMQPIYVFRGDDNFVGYVQAVRAPSISPTPTVN